MKYLLGLAVLSLSLTACVSTTPQVADNEPTVRIEGFDKKDEQSLREQLTQGLTRELKKFNTPVQVNNITRFHEYKKAVNGQNHSFLEFHTADGKIYRSRQGTTTLTDEQRQKLSRLKGATFKGVLPIQDKNNEFVFGGLENPVY